MLLASCEWEGGIKNAIGNSWKNDCGKLIVQVLPVAYPYIVNTNSNRPPNFDFVKPPIPYLKVAGVSFKMLEYHISTSANS